MDAIAFVQFIYEAGNELVNRCESVKQCHSEATRIALRTVRTLGALEGASGEFSGNVPISAGLIELKGTLEQANELVKVIVSLLDLVVDGFEFPTLPIRTPCAVHRLYWRLRCLGSVPRDSYRLSGI